MLHHFHWVVETPKGNLVAGMWIAARLQADSWKSLAAKLVRWRKTLAENP